ncbi:MAG: energy transducer TonB [Holophagaceae bacterium]|nr:energy transducer TonB [Holophagaceae bacterium]
MATYTRLGSFLLAGELTADPIGHIQRGVSIVGSAFDHHWLVRTFSEELLQAGLASKLGEASKLLPQLSGSKAFGQGYRIESSAPPHVTCDYVPGRTLAQMIEKAKVEQIPLGVDHALSILQGIAHGVTHLHTKGLGHGLLTPHGIWVSFEGATEILDAPYSQAIRQLLPKAPVTKGSLEAYIRETGGNALQQDFFSMGTILYELLTFEKFPVMAEPAFAASKATLKAAQEDSPVPPEILSLLKRLLGVGEPFENVQAFNAEMDHVLYDGDYSPTTFNMAFFMHTLFREENDRDGAAVKAEQADNFAAYSSEADSIHASRPHSEVSEAEQAQTTRVSKKGLYGGIAAAVVAVGVLGFFALKPKGESEEIIKMRTELAQLQAAQAEKEQQLAGASQANKEKLDILKKQQSEAKSAVDQARLEQQIREEERMKQELDQKKTDLKKQQDEARAKAAQIAQAAAPQPVPKTTPVKVEPPKPEPAKAEPPKPAAAAPAPTPARVQDPQPTPPVAQPPPSAPTIVQETAAAALNKAQPTFPMRAKQMRFEVDKPHSVKVKVFVDAQGRPQKVTVISGVDGAWGFNEAAHDAASRSTYTPATRDGKPVAGYTIVEYVFGPAGRR